MFHVSPHWLWLKPLADACAGAAIAFVAGALQRAVPEHATNRRVLWAVTAGLLLSVALPYRSSLGSGSLVLIAAGAAVPASYYLMRAEKFLGGRGGTLASTATVLCLLAVGAAILIVPIAVERRRAAGLGPVSAASPNIVLVVLDTVRAPGMEPGDRSIETLPNFAHLASSGVQFTQAIATSSWTLESHASLFTGLYPEQIFTNGETPINFETPFPQDTPTLAEALGRKGYVTGGFAGNTSYMSREHGLDRGFLHYDDYPLKWGDVVASSALGLKALEKLARWQDGPLPIGRRSAEQVTGAFLNWFDQQKGRPVFAYLNYFDAHDPYVPERGFRTGEVVEPYISPYRHYEADEVARLRHAYDDCVTALDHRIGRLIAALEERHALDSTVLVITSDHGEHFGEHDLMSHGNSLYRQALQVPLVIRYPAMVPAGTTVSVPVSLRDVPKTLMELAGLNAELVPGVSLSHLWSQLPSTESPSPVVSSLIVGRERHRFAPANWPVSRGSMRSVVAYGLHYILNGDGQEELYDWESDAGETRNLSTAPEQALALRRLRMLLNVIDDNPQLAAGRPYQAAARIPRLP